MKQEDWNAADSTGQMAEKALETAQKSNDTHGIAVALARQASYNLNYTNDFVLSEQLARQSLEWFGRTANKDQITRAYFELGYALFAESRFDEAIRYLRLA